MPFYSVITLSYNKLPCTKRCLGGLIMNTKADEPWELIVVDNGSTDGSAEWCDNELVALGAAHGIRVTVLHNSGNIGCSFARNRAIAVAKGRMLVFVDNDVTPRTQAWLGGLRNVLESVPDAGMVGPKMVYPWRPFPIQCAGVGVSKRGHICFRGRGEPIDSAAFGRQEIVQCLISACLMMPAELVGKFGGFDEAFHPVQFEDFDLVYRLREKGLQAVYTPAVEMYHFESVTTQGTPTVRNAAVVVRNGLLFQKRWRGMFEREDGPADDACRWRKIDPVSFVSIGELPLI
jgi:GT2 family glycosyltransferase